MNANDPTEGLPNDWASRETEPGEDTHETQPMPSRAGRAGGSGAPPQATGPYRLGNVLGEGGMALVFEAHDSTLDRQVAVKVMRPALVGDAELQSRFLHEARILGQLEHPGVVPIFTAGRLAGHGPYYAMKRVRGRTLREIFKAMHPRDFQDRSHTARLVGIFEKVCQTVAYAHSAGILHRDLKPENVMVDEFGVVVVLDWGLSKKITASPEEQGIVATQVGVVKGTPAYMSPEQASGSPEALDFRTDVFSLGIVLYEILTGSLPFSGHSRTDVMEKVLHHEPPHPRALNRQASRTLAAICMKALNKDPNRRYPTAQELAEDIRLYRDLLPTSAYRPGPLEALGNWIGRHRPAAAAIGTALLLLLSFAGFALHRREAARIRRQEQTDREHLVAQLDEQREKEKTQATLLSIRTGIGQLRELDERILALQADLPKAADAPARAAIQRQIDELDTIRYIASNNLRSVAIGLITQLSCKAGGDLAQVDPDILKFFRGIAVESVRALVKRHDYYKAHYYLWDFLRTDRDVPANWSEEQLAELKALRRQVEEKLREGQPPDAPLPDWSRHAAYLLSPKPK
ncbi:MAG TPA: serine/threonine-protein kinase [Planctomycetota bacterium]|nr:serine/threonine-protein kinase [Planctomycetota bacterium]HRR78658.1 serine/threonine-protein kinase [Planctomycetota bacterium]HRT97308.1 serine/threonine-protein kinase [Planctomycetota bacterium]